ncbi:MAG: amino acid ABC transporter ATP-binding protein [Clostridium sp.]
MSILEIKNIKKSFGEDLEVLQDISLAVEEGEVVSILGPSGSGKSTLLRCATFLEQIDSGSIAYGGKVYVENDTAGNAKKPERAKILQAQSNFGLVFQDFNLFPHFSVLKNVMDAPVKNQKRPKQEVEKEARALLAKMGLEGKEDAYPCELSGGQKQRVAIARALALRPKMLYFDEPTSALDPEITAEILRVLKGLAAEKMTMVIVTHEIDFARAVSDRVIFMDGGKVVEEGRPEEVIDNPKNERTKAFLQKLQV